MFCVLLFLSYRSFVISFSVIKQEIIVLFSMQLKRYYLVSTLDVQMWHVAEFDSEEVSRESLGQFYSTDSYVIKWVYSISYTGN